MNKLFVIICCIFVGTIAVGQNKPTKKAQPIIEEGKRLYKSEMASWHGTDLFSAKYKTPEKAGGYFSYTEGATSKCVFYSNDAVPKVIATIIFEGTIKPETGKIEQEERKFTALEKDYYELRTKSVTVIEQDTLFKFYENTRFNIVPIIEGGKKRVYVLTAPIHEGVVIFGNDYLLTFNKKNKLKEKKALHQNIIPIEYGDEGKGGNAIHSHSDETGQHITATDVCTLMLYGKYTNWEQHLIHSRDYLSIWNCTSNDLLVMPHKVLDKIDADQKKRKEAGEHKNR